MPAPHEIAFRLRQEAVNAARLIFPPRLHLRRPLHPARVLPAPAACADSLRHSPFAAELVRIAEAAVAHRFSIFGQSIETGPEIDWRRDYRHGKSSGAQYFRRVPYLDFEKTGDHKWIWELNRHQHFVALAQAFLLTGRLEFIREIERQMESWILANRFLRGVNWASALEVAFRALSWIWVDHLAGDRLSRDSRIALQQTLWLHARYLESNLSIYFSPNTHLLGEALALFATGRLYPQMPGASRFARRGGALVESQLEFQVQPDGSHFEQSTYYHVYALDMFLLYYVLAGRPSRMEPRIRQMAYYLDALAGPARTLFSTGDDDGGRLFHPYGARERFCRATLATCAHLFPDAGLEYCARDAHEQAGWWLGCDAGVSGPRRTAPRPHVAFPDSGMVTLVSGPIHVLFDAGPFGWRGAGHSHADTLNLLIRRGDDALLNDSGTFTYVADPAARNWFRGTGAHNTIRIDGLDQADPVKPFRWENKPAARLDRSGEFFADAQCRYRGFIHRRRVLLCGEDFCIVVDDISGPPGDHLIEQFWNITGGVGLATSAPYSLEPGWRSDVYASRVEVRRAVVRRRGLLPLRLASALSLNGPAGPMELIDANAQLTIRIAGILAMFPNDSAPVWRRD